MVQKGIKNINKDGSNVGFIIKEEGGGKTSLFNNDYINAPSAELSLRL